MTFQRTPLQIALRKRADALRSIELRKRTLAALEQRVRDLDAEIEAMGGTKPRAPRLHVRANGEMQRALFDLLRERGAATSADLAAVMLARFNLPADDPETAYAMRQRCIQAFKRCERKGLVRCVGGVGKGGKFKRWARADSAPSTFR